MAKVRENEKWRERWERIDGDKGGKMFGQSRENERIDGEYLEKYA